MAETGAVVLAMGLLLSGEAGGRTWGGGGGVARGRRGVRAVAFRR
ncbi:hypothetical protein Shyd_79440 [Streptomyces hydrogenans]|uniref:Uncharacterized protein n=1 Tax=Streptomyces hydrogenans TaxID=1873719 RepID=A0ABQ3PNI6_9ACTN|nr:hypothetical protein GCM10018784_52780 [Streptomyces hydrogenans]GHI26573.1 hypothetical protein Shyd_79440 [Streptomyces hydrogenans]